MERDSVVSLDEDEGVDAASISHQIWAHLQEIGKSEKLQQRYLDVFVYLFVVFFFLWVLVTMRSTLGEAHGNIATIICVLFASAGT